MQKVHLDTDLGGDIDDLCALAMLLRWPGGVELTGITVVGDTFGRRTGYVRRVLELADRTDIPLAAGAETSGGYYPYDLGLPDELRYWGGPVPPSPNPLRQALDLLKKSIEHNATLIGIGPYTNLYLLDLEYPGILQQARLFLMGGYVFPPRQGFPAWGNAMDFNIQVDVRSAQHVLTHSNPTLIPLSVTVETALRRSYLPDLRRAGRLGQLIARQMEAFTGDEHNEENYGKTCPGLPRDIINFQHDPLACAVALGWADGIEIQELPLLIEVQEGLLTERIHPAGSPIRMVTKIDGGRFNEFWLRVVSQP